MLPGKVIDMLRVKEGNTLRYPFEIDALSIEIKGSTGEVISKSALKRLLGMASGTYNPQLHTLDVLAHYLNYENWDDLIVNAESHDNASEFADIKSDSLHEGDLVHLGYEPDSTLTLRCLGNCRFVIAECKGSKLNVGDELEVLRFSKSCPLMVSKVFRRGKDIGSYLAGRVSGITFLELEGKNRKKVAQLKGISK
jgi:hypothetical protein